MVTQSARAQAGYSSRRQALASTLADLPPGPMRLQKETSNLFRHRNPTPHHALDISAFSQVLNIDTESILQKIPKLILFIVNKNL